MNDGFNDPPGNLNWLLPVIPLAVIIVVIMLLTGVGAHGRDLHGQYAQSPLKSWFDKLRSEKGPCCSDADGYAISDVDWESKDGRFRVRVPRWRFDPTPEQRTPLPNVEMVWVDVDEEAVVKEPNLAGKTMVWPIWGYQGPSIRCFIPGAMT